MQYAQNAVENNAVVALPFLAAAGEELLALGVGAWRLYRTGEAAKALVNAAPETSEDVTQRLSGGSGGGMSPDEDPDDDKGKKPVREMSDDEYVQSLADRADKRFEGKGPRGGTQKHKYAEQVHKRYQRMTGERRHMEAEKRFAKGEYWKPRDRTKGTSTPDVYNKRTNEAYDYKFGDATMSARQRQKYEANLPKTGGQNASIHTVKPSTSNG